MVGNSYKDRERTANYVKKIFSDHPKREFSVDDLYQIIHSLTDLQAGRIIIQRIVDVLVLQAFVDKLPNGNYQKKEGRI